MAHELWCKYLRILDDNFTHGTKIASGTHPGRTLNSLYLGVSKVLSQYHERYKQCR